ncbi:MAG: AmmeMemoRadiSam system protein B [Armatimonadota bacterium]|nr:AmmeMemoRadiSam system protein B [Armatimonadota bacterium]MDW8026582.1 AmmeMemoRadiSam system protein B [Armatimonadota bacterium]
MGRRMPAVAGSFYEGTAERLRRQIENCFLHRLGPGKLPPPDNERRTDMPIIGLVCPHAGYMYSGPTAARAYFAIASQRTPEVVIIIGPDHHGLAGDVSVYPEGVWVTPLGEVLIASDVAKRLVEACPIADESELAHRYEHSLEVQVPFIQFCFGQSVPIVPVMIGHQTKDVAMTLGDTIAQVIHDTNAVIIASTDFTHYEPQSQAKKKDELILKRIEAIDPDGVFDVVRKHRVTMCGYGPTAALLYACRKLGCESAKVLGYSTSGDIIGDYSQVVGYGAVAVFKAGYEPSSLQLDFVAR